MTQHPTLIRNSSQPFLSHIKVNLHHDSSADVPERHDVRDANTLADSLAWLGARKTANLV